MHDARMLLLLTCPLPPTQHTGEHYNGALSLEVTPVSIFLMEMLRFFILYVIECGAYDGWWWYSYFGCQGKSIPIPIPWLTMRFISEH
jgi:hypothetical protein